MNRLRAVLLASAILIVPWLLPPSAAAGPNEGGTLILHANPSLVFTSDIQNYCGMSALDSCSAAVTSVAWDPGKKIVFHVLAAFPSESSPRLKALSFGIDYDPTKFMMAARSTCADFELSDGTWPAAGTGTSQSWTTGAQTGLLTEVYWFAGYAYSEQDAEDSTSVSLIPHPLQHGVFVDDAVPAEVDTIAGYGRLGLGTAGGLPCPVGGDQAEGGEGWDNNEETPPEDEVEQAGGLDAPSSSGDLTFVEMTTTADSTFAVEAQALRSEYGLRILVGLTPDGLICRASQTQRDALSEDNRVNLVTDAAISARSDLEADDLGPGDPGFAARVWNELLTAEPPDSGRGGFAQGDSCIHYEVGEERNDRVPADPERQTSVYMLGDIGVSVLLMESQQTGTCAAPNYPEDWTAAERNKAVFEVGQGLTSLANLSPEPYATFWISETPPPLATTVEPIQRAHGDTTWVSEALTDLGFTEGSYTTRMAELCNSRRARPQTPYDWWFITFVIDDSCDPDHRFSDGWVGFGSFYGPRVTLPYIGGYTYWPDDLSAVAMHEACHIFGAADEYYATSCESLCGYLGEVNGNDIACVDPQVPCIMDSTFSGVLCDYTRAHIGWRDSDDPPDGVYDPIDHPDSYMSMLVGEGDSVGLGDRIDIYNANQSWVKRLTGSRWSSDRGRVLWDGIDYNGLPATTGAYSWKRNGGTSHGDSLRADTEAPVITDLVIMPSSGGLVPDTLSLRFEDGDTHSGRVRAVASMPGLSDVRVIQDRFCTERPDSTPSIRQTYNLPHDGLWTITLRIWDVGAGHEASQDSSYWHGSLTGVGDRRILVPELTLTRGRPNPSGSWVAWDLQLPAAGAVDLRVVGVDGRCVKSWVDRNLPGGITRILWDGRDGKGAGVASGRYWLVATDRAGRTTSMPAIIVR
jgi:hypothetical protein